MAEANIARMREPLDSPRLADFVAALDPVYVVADAAPGFVWRLHTEDGNATAVHAFEWDRRQRWRPGQHVGLGVGRGARRVRLRRCAPAGPPAPPRSGSSGWRRRRPRCGGYRAVTPTTGEAEERAIHLRESGPTAYAFTLKEHFLPPDAAGSGPARGPIRSPEERTCPA